MPRKPAATLPPEARNGPGGYGGSPSRPGQTSGGPRVLTAARVLGRLECTDPAADGRPIVITAQAVPWGVVAPLGFGDTIEFAPGSVTAPADAGRVPFLADHDAHALGYGVSFTATATGLDAVMAVPQDELTDPRTAAAVRQMRNGVRSAVSVGVDVDSYDVIERDGHDHYVITAAPLRELSSVLVPRFDDARVASIAASWRETTMTATATTTPPPAPPDPDDPDGPDDPDEVTAAAVIPAHRRPSRPPTGLSLAGIAARIAAAGSRGRAAEANRILEDLTAAWTDVTTTDVEALVRPQWLTEVEGLQAVGRPVSMAFRSGTITSSPIKYPRWIALPTVDVQAVEKTAIPSGPVDISESTVNVITLAGGNDVSRQTIDWSTPDFVAEYFRAATEVWARKADARFMTNLAAGAGFTVAVGTNGITEAIGAAIGVAAGSGVGGTLNIVVAGDVYGGLWTELLNGGPGIFGAVNAGFPVPRIVVAPLAAKGTIVAAMSQSAVAFTSPGAPVRLQALDVPRGGVDLAVWGYWADEVLYPEAVCTVTGYVPPLVATVPVRTGETSSTSTKSK